MSPMVSGHLYNGSSTYALQTIPCIRLIRENGHKIYVETCKH